MTSAQTTSTDARDLWAGSAPARYGSPDRIGSAGGTSKDAHLAAALALLDERGARASTRVFTASDAARVAGVDRSTIYRYWPTATALNDDFARWACTTSSWQNEILAADPRAELRDVMRVVLAAPMRELGAAMRSIAVGVSQTSVARCDIAAWERTWLDAFAGWIEAHAQAHGRRCLDGVEPLDVALAVTAVIEGSLLLASYDGGHHLDGWTDARAEQVVLGTLGVVGGMTARGSAPPSIVEPVARAVPGLAQGWSASKLRIIERIAAGSQQAAFRDEGAPGTARLVDFGLLSARAGVTVRRLYGVWPTVASFNGDLIEVVLDRLVTGIDACAAEVLADAVVGVPEDGPGLVPDLCDAWIEDRSGVMGLAPFACVAAIGDPTVRSRGARVLDAWLQRQPVNALAILHTMGYDLRPTIDPRGMVDLVVAMVTGARRLALLHPDVSDRRVHRGGRAGPSCSFGLQRLLGSLAAGR